MGSPCSCSRHSDRIQLITNDAVVAKCASPSSAALDSCPPLETVSRQLSTYLQENKTYMNKKLTQLFTYTIENPTEALSSLQLKLCQMKDSDWTHFSMLVTYGKAARQLMIWKTNLSQQGFEFVCSYLGILTKITTLTLEDTGLGKQCIPKLATGLKRLPNLTALNLGVNDLSADSLQQLSTAFPSLPNLTQCTLDENKLGDKGCEILQKGVDLLPKLTLLSVRYNGVTDQGARLLVWAVEKRKELRIFADGNEIEEGVLECLKQVNPAQP